MLVDPAGVGGFDIASPTDGASTADFTFATTNAVGRSTGGGFSALGRTDNGGPIAGSASAIVNGGANGTYFTGNLLTGGQVIEAGDLLEFSIDVARTTSGPASGADVAAFLILSDGVNLFTHILTDDSTLTGTNAGRVTIATVDAVAGVVQPVNLTDNSTVVGSGGTYTSAVLEFTLNSSGPGGNQNLFDNLSLELTDVSAVPEPSSLAIVGLVGLGLFTRRRK